MASYKTEAIIIGRHNFGEADRIIVLLTPDRGVVRGVAKGVRRIKSRLAGHLELFSRSELMLAEGRNLDVITSARLQSHVSIGDNYEAMRLAYLIAEMTNRLSGEGEHPGLFNLVRDSLEAVTGEPDVVLEFWFKLRLLDELGYRPELDACVVCGGASPDSRYQFDIERGGIVDEAHQSASSRPISHEQIKFWRLVLRQPLKTIRRVEGVGELSAASLLICNLFYDHTFGQRFRSAEVLG